MNGLNALGQPVGLPVEGWTPPQAPSGQTIEGRYCRVEPLDADAHCAELYAANALDDSGANWTYLPYGPFASLESYRAWMRETCTGGDPLFHAIVDLELGRAVGVATYMRIDARSGVIEVGHINYSPLLQRRRAGTEAMYLLMRRAFELGYRRYEWKCDALNGPSRAAAQRLGFSYEGTFRQATIYKGRNRDTAWYSVIDSEWPALAAAYETWLAPHNFNADGTQNLRLSDLTRPLLKCVG